MTNKYFSRHGIFTFLIAFVFTFPMFCQDVFAETNVVVTYDISSSMFRVNKKQDRYFLSAGEFKALADAVLYLLFDGDPTENTRFSGLRDGTFFSTPHESDDTSPPFWNSGDGLIYVEYTHEAKVVLDTRGRNLSRDRIVSLMREKMPYPRGVPPSAQRHTVRNNRSAFKKAFPGNVSLQTLAEVKAFRTFHEMVIGGDQKARVVWIKVSDEDMDTTQDTRYQAKADKLAGELYKLKEKIYKDSKPHNVYQVKAGGRVWIRVYTISFFSKQDATEALARAQRQLAETQALLEAEERKRREAERKLEEERKRREDAARKLGLKVDGKEVGDYTVQRQVKFKRVKTSEPTGGTLQKMHAYLLDTLGFYAAEGNETNFEIKETILEIRDIKGRGLPGHKYRITPLPVVGSNMKIKIPDSPELRKSGSKAKLTVNYEFSAGDDKRVETKGWLLDSVRFPGPSFLQKFWWLTILVPVMVVVAVAIILANARSGPAPPPDPISPPGPRPIGDAKTTERRKRLFPDAPAGIGVKAVEETRTSRLRLSVQGDVPRVTEIKEGSTIVFANEDRTIGMGLWELDCPGHSLSLKGGQLYQNGSIVDTGSVLTVKNRSGEDLEIHIEPL